MIKKLTSIAVLASLSIFATPAMAAGIDSNTLLMMHCDDMTDSSSNNFSLTPVGGASISSAESQFGGNSCLFDGIDDSIEMPDSSIWDFGINNFTIDTWIRLDTVSPQYQSIIGNWGVDGNHSWLLSVNTNRLQFWYSINGSQNYVVTSSPALSVDTWHHVAYERDGTTFRIYVDGNIVATHNSFNATLASPDQILLAGRNDNNPAGQQYLDGYLDELRISDIPRYSGAFTPETSAYSGAPTTVAGAVSNAVASTSQATASAALNYVSDLVGNETEVLDASAEKSQKVANGVKEAVKSMGAADENLSDVQALIDQMLGLSTAGMTMPETLQAIRAWRL